MVYDEDIAGIFRDELAGVQGITEKKMFGGLCFMLNGNMLCGVHKDGGMARVGKENEQAALNLDGVEPLSFTGRKMGGMVEFDEATLKKKRTRNKILKLSLEFVSTLPPKKK